MLVLTAGDILTLNRNIKLKSNIWEHPAAPTTPIQTTCSIRISGSNRDIKKFGGAQFPQAPTCLRPCTVHFRYSAHERSWQSSSRRTVTHWNEYLASASVPSSGFHRRPQVIHLTLICKFIRLSGSWHPGWSCRNSLSDSNFRARLFMVKLHHPKCMGRPKILECVPGHVDDIVDVSI